MIIIHLDNTNKSQLVKSFDFKKNNLCKVSYLQIISYELTF